MIRDRVFVLVLAALTASCAVARGNFGPYAYRPERRRPTLPERPTLPFTDLGHDPSPIVIEPFNAGGMAYAFHAERTPTDQTLRAVTVSSDQAWAVGDKGTILRRTPDGWVPEPSGTEADLFGVASGVAVGSGGTILRRTVEGAWVPEPSPTTETLHGVWSFSGQHVAVGDHGTLLVRSDGSWSPIDTHTTEDLHSFAKLLPQPRSYLVGGRHGALVFCSLHALRLSCAPLPPIGTADLAVVAYNVTPLVFDTERHLYMSSHSYRPELSSPPQSLEFQPRGCLLAFRGGPSLAVGDAGSIAVIDREHYSSAPLHVEVKYAEGANDLHAIALREDDREGFAVGAKGSILRVTAEPRSDQAELAGCKVKDQWFSRPARIGWSAWWGGGVGLVPADSKVNGIPLLRLGSGADFSISRYGLDEDGSANEIRLGPWIGADASLDVQTVEIGAQLDFGYTGNVNGRNKTLRVGGGYERVPGEAVRTSGSATVLWGLRTVPGRQSFGGNCYDHGRPYRGIDIWGAPPRVVARSLALRFFLTFRLDTEEDSMFLFGVEYAP